jgi:hypothetical protein
MDMYLYKCVYIFTGITQEDVDINTALGDPLAQNFFSALQSVRGAIIAEIGGFKARGMFEFKFLEYIYIYIYTFICIFIYLYVYKHIDLDTSIGDVNVNRISVRDLEDFEAHSARIRLSNEDMEYDALQNSLGSDTLSNEECVSQIEAVYNSSGSSGPSSSSRTSSSSGNPNSASLPCADFK